MNTNAPIMFAHPGTGDFIRLAGASVLPRYRKEVLRVWEGVDPNTGKALKFTLPFLELLAKNTNEYLRLGHDVYAPDGHTDKAMDNLGRWTSFEVEGDRLYGTFEPADADVDSRINTRIRGVSVYARGPVLTTAGTKLSAAILHVCLTPCPVLPNQEEFIQLALAASKETPAMPDETPAAPPPVETKLATDTPPPASGMTPREFMLKAEALLGVADSSWESLLAALRSCIVDDDDNGIATGAPAVMAMLARREKALETKLAGRFAKDLEAVRAQAKAFREAHANDLISMTRKRSADSGLLFDKDASEFALSLLSSENEREQKAGRAVLAAQDKLAESAIKLAHGCSVATPEHEAKAKAAVAESDSAVSSIVGQWDPKRRTIPV